MHGKVECFSEDLLLFTNHIFHSKKKKIQSEVGES